MERQAGGLEDVALAVVQDRERREPVLAVVVEVLLEPALGLAVVGEPQPVRRGEVARAGTPLAEVVELARQVAVVVVLLQLGPARDLCGVDRREMPTSMTTTNTTTTH